MHRCWAPTWLTFRGSPMAIPLDTPLCSNPATLPSQCFRPFSTGRIPSQQCHLAKATKTQMRATRISVLTQRVKPCCLPATPLQVGRMLLVQSVSDVVFLQAERKAEVPDAGRVPLASTSSPPSRAETQELQGAGSRVLLGPNRGDQSEVDDDGQSTGSRLPSGKPFRFSNVIFSRVSH